MKRSEQHTRQADVSFDGGNLDCGNGLLLLIRRHIDPLMAGQLLEIQSQEPSVEDELPAWCRLTDNELVSWTSSDGHWSFLVCKGRVADSSFDSSSKPEVEANKVATNLTAARVEFVIPDSLPEPTAVPPLRPLSVMGVGSWPRPKWMMQSIHSHLQGQIPDSEFQETANDAVRLAVAAQEAAGADVISDGEQRRDSYSSFVGGILCNSQLIPLTDLAAMVDDSEKFEAELRALDVPAKDVRHPVVFGKLGRIDPLVLHELTFAQKCTDKPIKVALPGPYLLTRTLWLDCLEDLPYENREEMAIDIVRVLREELAFLLASGASIVQFDEPVLTEVVFTGSSKKRSFMCGALSEKGAPEEELNFAVGLMNDLIRGFPKDRIAVHVCRGNWTKDENALLSGNYTALEGYLKKVEVGTLFLELSTPRAGEMKAVAELDTNHRIGVGSVNPRIERVETVEEICAHIEEAISLFGVDRVLMNSDCGFATFADNPVASSEIAQAKLRSMALASDVLRRKYNV